MTDRLALMGKPKSLEGMEDHCQRLGSCSPHIDGWTHELPADKQAVLLQQLRREGHFWLLIEKGGTVYWRVKVTDAAFVGEGISPWRDSTHGDSYDEPVHTLLVYAECHRDGRDRGTLVKWKDRSSFAAQSRSGSGRFDYVLVDWE